MKFWAIIYKIGSLKQKQKSKTFEISDFPVLHAWMHQIHTNFFFYLDLLVNSETASPPAFPAPTPIPMLVPADIPKTPADCAAAIKPQALAAATPPPLAMAGADINFAAKDPTTMPPAEKPAADKASGAATTARPPTTTPLTTALAIREVLSALKIQRLEVFTIHTLLKLC